MSKSSWKFRARIHMREHTYLQFQRYQHCNRCWGVATSKYTSHWRPGGWQCTYCRPHKDCDNNFCMDQAYQAGISSGGLGVMLDIKQFDKSQRNCLQERDIQPYTVALWSWIGCAFFSWHILNIGFLVGLKEPFVVGFLVSLDEPFVVGFLGGLEEPCVVGFLACLVDSFGEFSPDCISSCVPNIS